MRRLRETTEEQDMLAEALARYLRERHPFETRRHAARQDGGTSAPLWRGLADDLGVLGAALPEACGGLGGDAADHALIMEELGYALASEPYLSTVVIGAGLLQQCDTALCVDLLRRIVAGQAVIGFAYAEPAGRYDLADIRTQLAPGGSGYLLNGHKSVVRNAPSASHFLVTARTGASGDDLALALLTPGTPGMSRRDYATVDGGQASELYFHDVSLTACEVLIGHGALPAIEKAMDDATVALCAEALGVMRRLCDDTAAFARERRQFGVPIASFQVLRHRMADMLMHLEQARAITDLTVGRLAQAGVNRARLVSSAKVTTAQACRFIGQGAIQIHGGMGMTDELPVGHYFKRATVIEGLFGTADHHLRRYAGIGPAVA